MRTKDKIQIKRELGQWVITRS